MKQWHYAVNDAPEGSFTSAEIEEFFRSGKLKGGSLVWTEGMQHWQTLRDTKDFNHLFRQNIPPPLPSFSNSSVSDDVAKNSFHTPTIENDATPVDGQNDIRLIIEQSQNIEPAGPWSRYFARLFDLSVLCTALLMGISVALAYNSPGLFFKLASLDDRALFLVFLPLAHLLNAIIVTIFGNSIGKALFGIKAIPLGATRRFSFAENIGREFRVWTFGLAFGIPLVCLFTMVPAFNKVSKREPTSYDEGKSNVFAFSKSKLRRALAMLISIAVLVGIAGLNALDKETKKQAELPWSWSNPDTSMTAMIPGGWQYEKVSGPTGEPLYGFTNMNTGVVALFGQEQLADETISTYAARLARALSGKISLGQWQLSEISGVWVVNGTVKDGNHPAKIYATQRGSAFWRVVLVDQVGSGQKEISEPEVARALLSSAGVP